MGSLYASERVGFKPGYLDGVEEDRATNNFDLPEPPPAPLPPGKLLSEIIFDEKLSREFKNQYQTWFGQTGAEQAFILARGSNFEVPNRFDWVETGQGAFMTSIDDNNRRRQFGNYMVRRIIEHHTDRYFRTNKDFRPIYEVKEKLTNLDMQVRPNYKVKVSYSLSGNFLTVDVVNPYKIKTTYNWYVSGTATYMSNESVFQVGVPVGSKSMISTQYKMRDGIVAMVGRTRLTARMEGSLTLSTDFQETGVIAKENVALLGLSWTL